MRIIVIAGVLATLVGSGAANGAPLGEHGRPGSQSVDSDSVYIVELADEPLATYDGGIGGLAATKPVLTGATRLDTSSQSARAYDEHLTERQDRVIRLTELATDREIEPLHRYRNVLNGFAVRMTAEEAASVERLPGVARVTRSFRLHQEADAGPGWIGAPGIWDGSAVPGGVGSLGEGVIVGILDSGINMDHPSFAAVGADGYAHTNPFGDGVYSGFCDPDHPLNDPMRWECNAKLIGAWSWPEAGNDPEDDYGTGSHAAGVAAGNFVDAVITVPTTVITMPLSGVAPHANIIAYDTGATGTAGVETVAAAVDQAVADGVDVLNMSYGPDATELDPWADGHLYARAFLNATAAGIVTSFAAGSLGPGEATVTSIAPWMPATAATTHNRVVVNTLAAFSGGEEAPPPDLVGTGLTSGYGPAQIVSAEGKLHADGTADDGRCLTPFPAGTFDGEIVVCVRGAIPRVEKGTNVLAGGAGGLVLANSSAEGAGVVADAYDLPAVHISYSDAELLQAWMSTGDGHRAAISGMEFVHSDEKADVLSSLFTARGPTWMQTCCLRPTDIVDWQQGGFFGRRMLDVLKPNASAPGVDIWAAWDSDLDGAPAGPEYGVLTGSSTASAHHAGAMALLRAVHPEWSPMAVESALMTTAHLDGVRAADGTTPATPFDVGAGRIDVAAAANAGFILEETAEALASASPMDGGEPSELNVAGLADFSCLARCVFTRTLTSTLDDEMGWTVSTMADDGLQITVEPSAFTMPAGGSFSVAVTVDVAALAAGEQGFARVMFIPTKPEVPAAHFAVAVKSVDVVLPSVVLSDVGSTLDSDVSARVVVEAPGPEGSVTLPGWRLKAVPNLWVRPLQSAVAEASVVQLTRDMNADPFGGGPSTATMVFQSVVHPARLAAEIRSSTSLNVDLYMGPDLNEDGVAQADERTCSSVGGSWTEMCEIEEDLFADRYWVVVHNAAFSPQEAIDTVDVRYGVSEGRLVDTMQVVGPSSAETGVPFDIQLSWDFESLDPGDVAYGRFFIQNAGATETYVEVLVDIVRPFGSGPLYLPDLRGRATAAPTMDRPKESSQ